MGYKAPSEQCPIFNTDNDQGVEHEIVGPVRLSCTVTTYPVFQWSPGREVVLQEAWLLANVSSGLTTSISCTLQIASDASLSTVIGSIAFGTAEQTDLLVCLKQDASLTSTALTSTDIVSVYMIVGAHTCSAGGHSVVLRYREK